MRSADARAESAHRFRLGGYFFQTSLRRRFYKLVASAFCRRRLTASKALASSLCASGENRGHDIGEQGYLVLPPSSASDLRSRAIDAGARVAAERDEGGQSIYGYEFLRNLLSADNFLPHGDAILRYGLSDELIQPVARYLGHVPVMPQFFLWRSLPTDISAPVGSQLWHLDHTDTIQVKVFVFIDDVTTENGALNLIPAPVSQKLRRKLRYNWQKRRRISDAEMFRFVDPDRDVVKITGRKGTVAFVDTSHCFHFGSRLQEGTRHVLHYLYLTYTNFIFNPFQIPPRYPLAPLATSSGLTPLQKSVLVGSPVRHK